MTILDRSGETALWRQIAARLEAAIAEGEHGPEDRLPSEGALSARFGVNRHTVRRALEELERRGLIRTEQGRGSFVAGEVLDYPLHGRTRFFETVRAQRREPAGRILRLGEVSATAAVAEALGIARRAPVLRVERLGMADGCPVVLGVHHLPLPRFAAAEAALRGAPSITAALAACGVADYRRARTRISARLPTGEEAQLLRQSRGRPVLASEALNLDAEGRPVDFTLACYAAGRVHVLVEEEQRAAMAGYAKGDAPLGASPF
ncbi:GntR family transcriptional regulator, phosphonate transport system regulatory protein [Roseomonas rosea]|uniref:GntR family transcriptional regulator, phosphonate transport system regulatory protein n=1 Tax=Muricoccus roseus TaxID=198092 RepID=A0A1M6F2N7_9PROT|nr:phosphonate metabolism transcriptional regulator PhnF [Roseomonas rosea]SHI91925.1 GntR family transcriptional regulator, phosphonate transport system regulatory protein [Roseomonas rosea]